MWKRSQLVTKEDLSLYSEVSSIEGRDELSREREGVLVKGGASEAFSGTVKAMYSSGQVQVLGRIKYC